MIELPACVSTELKVDGNRARQILVPPQSVEITHGRGGHRARLLDGRYVKLVATRRGLGKDEIALKAPAEKVRDPSAEFATGEVSWITMPKQTDPATVVDSLEGKFAFVEASEDGNRPGLWMPQLGAIHAILGYWTTEGTDPATVVMPTGTGKTEAMVGLFAARRSERVLVVVPSDALRKQIAGKFELLGVLQGFGVIDAEAQRPVVGQLDHRFSSADSARRFCQACNVIVTTPPALLPPSAPDISKAVLDSCSHLFVDEAHHVEARTWRQIRDEFEGKPVLQFTATPFREDGIPLAGRQVYRYPLSVAQAHGYFAQIDYTSVVDLHDPDRALAELAIERLREDLDAELDHVLMARVKGVRRAEQLEELYCELAPDLGPVAIHSLMRVGDRSDALASLDSRETRVVVCVDMLGEGFDPPALKIAAIHDPHKSLGVTLQFVGRFARVGGEDIGTAAVFVGRPDFDFNHGLRRLFAEDADWNQLISDLSEDRTRLEEEVSEFESGLVPIQTRCQSPASRRSEHRRLPHAVRRLESRRDPHRASRGDAPLPAAARQPRPPGSPGSSSRRRRLCAGVTSRSSKRSATSSSSSTGTRQGSSSTSTARTPRATLTRLPLPSPATPPSGSGGPTCTGRCTASSASSLPTSACSMSATATAASACTPGPTSPRAFRRRKPRPSRKRTSSVQASRTADASASAGR